MKAINNKHHFYGQLGNTGEYSECSHLGNHFDLL